MKQLKTAAIAAAIMVATLSALTMCFTTDAIGQSMRKFTCELFQCQQFVDLVGQVTTVETNTQAILNDTADLKTQVGYTVANTTTIAQDLQRVEGKIDALSIPPNPEYADELYRIEKKLNYVMLPESSIWLESYESAGGGEIMVEVWVKGESLTIVEAFGMDINYPSANLTYAQIFPGEFTQSWTGLDANELTPGHLRLGGYAGAGYGMAGNGIGRLAVLRFTIVQRVDSTVSSTAHVDDIAGMTPPAASTIVRLQ